MMYVRRMFLKNYLVAHEVEPASNQSYVILFQGFQATHSPFLTVSIAPPSVVCNVYIRMMEVKNASRSEW